MRAGAGRGRTVLAGLAGLVGLVLAGSGAWAQPASQAGMTPRAVVVEPGMLGPAVAPLAPAGSGRAIGRRTPLDPGGRGRDARSPGDQPAPEVALEPGAAGAGPGPRAAIPGVSFAGLRRLEAGGRVPPDTQVAAGPAHVVEVVNTAVRVFSRTGAPLTTLTLQAFFGLDPAVFIFDPRIRFDVVSGRWFVSAVSEDGTLGRWHLAVSSSADPLGPFAIYRVATPGSLPDFPALGIASDKVVLTANAFSCLPSCDDEGPFLGTEFVVFDKAALLAGTDAAHEVFPPPQGLFSLQPAHSLSPITSLFMAGVEFGLAGAVRVFELTGVPGLGPGVGLASVDRPIRVLLPPPGAQQAGSAILLDAGDNRLLDTVIRDGRLWTAGGARCVPPGDVTARACLRLIEVDLAGRTVTQDLDFGAPGTHAFFPAIQLDQAGGLVVAFSRSSLVEFASVYATGRLATDPPGVIRPATRIKAGEAPYSPPSPTLNRWGDYSGASVDPVDPGTVWVAGEYARTEGGTEWGTWIAQVRLQDLAVFVAAGDLDGVGPAEVITGAGPGGDPVVRAFATDGVGPLVELLAYPPGTGGVRVAACDIDGDGRAEIVTGPGPGFPPVLRGWDGPTGAFLGELAVGPAGYLGGVFVACADVTGDGHAEVIATADQGVPPIGVVWQVFPGAPVLLAGGLVFEETFLGGVRVAACDLTGDRRADVVVATGPGGPPRIRVFDGGTGAELGAFSPFEPAFTGGVFVACGEVLPGEGPLVVASRGGAGPPEVRVFRAEGTPVGSGFLAYDAAFTGGVRIAVGSPAGGGPGAIVTGPGPGGGPVRLLTGAGTPAGPDFLAY